MKRGAISVISIIVLFLSGCSEQPGSMSGSEPTTADPSMPQPVTETSLLDCQDMNGMSVHCGFKNPEDLVLLPNGRHLLVSEMGKFMQDTPGRLSLLNLRTGEREDLNIYWPEPGSASVDKGDEACQPPDIWAFSPHGIDLTILEDLSLQLLVVNHGGREAVEFFDVSWVDGNWQLAWQGCASPPGDPFINDVVGRRDGGFYVTHMWDKQRDFEAIAEDLTSGRNTGWVWEWQPESGFTKMAGTDEMMPNGIAINRDNSAIFVNVYMGSRTIRVDTETGEIEGRFDVRQPDNITIDESGQLWITSHQQDPLGQNCDLVEQGPCILPYEIYTADPDTMEPQLFQRQEGPPMGYATVALKVGNRIYVGSAHGDRIVSMDIGKME